MDRKWHYYLKAQRPALRNQQPVNQVVELLRSRPLDNPGKNYGQFTPDWLGTYNVPNKSK